MLNDTTTGQLSTFILVALLGSGALGMELSLLHQESRRRVNPAITLPDLQREVRQLADKSLVVEFAPVTGSSRWRITALGVSAAQELGLLA